MVLRGRGLPIKKIKPVLIMIPSKWILEGHVWWPSNISISTGCFPAQNLTANVTPSTFAVMTSAVVDSLNSKVLELHCIEPAAERILQEQDWQDAGVVFQLNDLQQDDLNPTCDLHMSVIPLKPY